MFNYNDFGFELNLKSEVHSVRWTEIERIVAYKIDLYTFDEVCIEIIYDKNAIVITEEIQGWSKFIERLAKALPINKNWESEVLKTPFEENCTEVFEREDRKMPERSNFFSVIYNKTKDEVSQLFEVAGWRVHKPFMKGYSLHNSWTDLELDNDNEVENSLLLHGLVAYHPENVKIMEALFDQLSSPYQFEFYNDKHQLLMERTKKL